MAITTFEVGFEVSHPAHSRGQLTRFVGFATIFLFILLCVLLDNAHANYKSELEGQLECTERPEEDGKEELECSPENGSVRTAEVNVPIEVPQGSRRLEDEITEETVPVEVPIEREIFERDVPAPGGPTVLPAQEEEFLQPVAAGQQVISQPVAQQGGIAQPLVQQEGVAQPVAAQAVYSQPVGEQEVQPAQQAEDSVAKQEAQIAAHENQVAQQEEIFEKNHPDMLTKGGTNYYEDPAHIQGALSQSRHLKIGTPEFTRFLQDYYHDHDPGTPFNPA